MLTYQVESPILFLIFNRPETTEIVFQLIKKVQPKKLFIAADGPRKTSFKDIELCSKTREIVGRIDWDCEVKNLFRKENLGCKYSLSGAISWFFENVEEGIILEDDCVPSISFFSFCDSLLSLYRNDDRISIISGTNFQNKNQRGEASYFFSKFAYVWGWASWKRVWRKYDLELLNYDEKEVISILKFLIEDPKMREFWIMIFKKLKSGKINSWAYQFCFLNFFENFYGIVPNINLITNIGFGEAATHTIDPNNQFANLPRFELETIISPKNLIGDKKADNFVLKNQFQSLDNLTKLLLFQKSIGRFITNR